MPPLPVSRHFTLERLAEGVYAAIAKAEGLAVSNAGIVDLGDGVLIFDTLAAPQAARDLVTAAAALTGRSITAAINSHWHWDHVLGNQSFPEGTVILATHRTRELIAERIPRTIAEQRENIPRQIADLEAQVGTERDIEKRQEAGEWLVFYRMVMEDLPILELRLPNRTFDRRLVFHGSARTAELLSLGGGHTESDALLYLPDDRIAFVGDLLFNGRHPWLGDGDPDEWLRICAQIEALTPAVEVVVPGHGAVATPASFAALRKYIPALRLLVTAVSERRGTADDAAALAVPAAFSEWDNESAFAGNMRFLYQRLTASDT